MTYTGKEMRLWDKLGFCTRSVYVEGTFILSGKESTMRTNVYLLCIALMILTLHSSPTFALDPMGPPAAGLKQGQFSAGAEYSYSVTDVEANNVELTLGGVSIPGVLGSDTIENITSNKFYANVGFGLMDNWEVFLRLGAANLCPDEHDNADNVGGYIGDSDYGFAFGGGTKLTLWQTEDGRLKLGGLAQISWADLDFDRQSYPAMATVITSTEVDLLEIQAAVGASFSPIDGVWIYGGPFFHFISGEVDLDYTFGGVPGEISADLVQDSMFGGYVGGQIDIGENLSLQAEYQFTGAAWSVAAGIALKL